MTAVEHDKHQRTQVKVIAYLERVVQTGNLRADRAAHRYEDER
jgi:hypothetical protein